MSSFPQNIAAQQEQHLLGLHYAIAAQTRTLGMAIEQRLGESFISSQRAQLNAMRFEFADLFNVTYPETEPAERPAFVDAFPHLRGTHRAAQQNMFGAARDAGLDTSDREGFLRSVNYELGTSLTSRRQMTPDEMEYFTIQLHLGIYGPGWVRRNPATVAHFTVLAA